MKYNISNIAQEIGFEVTEISRYINNSILKIEYTGHDYNLVFDGAKKLFAQAIQDKKECSITLFRIETECQYINLDMEVTFWESKSHK